MIKNNIVRIAKVSAICLGAVVFGGCAEKTGQTENAAKPSLANPALPATHENPKALPEVTLTATKVEEYPADSVARVVIAASGPFGSNVVEKTDPNRIVVIMHNAKKGEAPQFIDVNDGTINRVEIDQLDTGNGTAVRITVGLDKKPEYRVTPAKSSLIIDFRKKS